MPWTSASWKLCQICSTGATAVDKIGGWPFPVVIRSETEVSPPVSPAEQFQPLPLLQFTKMQKSKWVKAVGK